MPIKASELTRFKASDQLVGEHLHDHWSLVENARFDAGPRAMLTIDVAGDELHISYVEAAANALVRDVPTNDGTPAEVYAELLACVVTAWDLLGDAGRPWPLDRNALEQLGQPVLAVLWGAVRQVEGYE